MRTNLLLASTCTLMACGDPRESSGTGSLQVVVAAEESIPLGLDPGTSADAIRDGWTIRFDKMVVAVGHFHAARSSGDEEISADEVYVLDLAQLPPSGFTLASFEEAASGRYDRVSYEVPAPTNEARRQGSVLQQDLAAMIDRGYSHWIEGTATREASTLRFEWGISAPTRYTDCGPEEGDLGFAVPSSGAAQVELTFHGDHFFFDGFPEGVENVTRRASWLEAADLDADGVVTTEELADSTAADLFSSSEHSFAGSPIPISSGLDWVTAQAHTLGHLQGEGECVVEPE